VSQLLGEDCSDLCCQDWHPGYQTEMLKYTKLWWNSNSI